jgi:TolB-like protein/tRNA A-37 threonylcarbamoyl transferase component Bud32/Flp pilus assembly protein TadD
LAIECPKCNFDNSPGTDYCVKCATTLPSPEAISAYPTAALKTPAKELTRGSTFSGRYEIIEELGEGGMGKVYRVEDKKIKEEVALKLIRPEIAADKKTIARFSNELKFARKVAHRNVCRMFDIDQEGETHYITMEYVPGQNLNGMIKMMGKLSPGQAITIAKHVCEGLAEAHRLGVVHRDLKSSNILIDKNGYARIMDFGIARSLRTKGITGAGVMIGTPEYMSPEQVVGKEADQRSDIYSLGVIMYEMMTGKLPFKGDSTLNIALKHKTAMPPDPRQLNAQISEDLCRVIFKCMEKEKKNRYQDTKELLSELTRIEEGIPTTERAVPKKKPTTLKKETVTFSKRWMAIAALFAVVAITVIAILYFRKEGPVIPPSEVKMLVVLPFDNLGPPEDEFFAAGLTEELTSRLSALHELGVISRTSARQYKKTDKTSKQIGKELGVDYVLEGAVRWDRSPDGQGQVRVTSQLIRVSDDINIWSQRYDRVINDIFSVQSEIAEQIARQLDITVLEPERRALYARPTDNLDAYQYYLYGREHEDKGWLHSDHQEFQLAVEMYEKATELDPDFAMAYTKKSIIHSRMYFFSYDRTEECLAKSRAAVNRALELQSDLPEAHLALAYYYYWGHLDYNRATEIFESIQKARPNFSPELLGYIQRRQGKWEESLSSLKKAFRLDPRYSQLAYQIGLSYLGRRRYDQAEEWFNRTISINQDHLGAQLGQIGIFVLSKGDTKKARAALGTLPQHQLTDYMWLTLDMLERNYKQVLDRLDSMPYDSFEEQHFYLQKNLAYADAYHAMKEVLLMKTHAESARILLEEAVREHPRDSRFHAALGLAHAYLGHKDEAIQEGNRAVNLYPVSKDPVLGPIYVLKLAKIYTVVGEYDEAVRQLEYLLSIPSFEYLWQVVSIPLLEIDPIWDPLRNHPEFQRLLEDSSEERISFTK